MPVERARDGRFELVEREGLEHDVSVARLFQRRAVDARPTWV
jgi:hypothetical protein